MAYIRQADYRRHIQDVNLNQVITADTSILEDAEIEAQAEAISYLTQKYDTESEFTDTTKFDLDAAYLANSLVEINFDDYSTATSYQSGALVIEAGYGYVCNTPTSGTFDTTKWEQIGKKYDLYYVKVPQMEFNYRNYYLKGDKVFYKNKVYTAAKDSPVLDHESALQYSSTKNFPYPNVFPDDPINGRTYWGVGVSFAVSASLPNDTAVWTKGDNRSVQLVHKVVDICLYNLHSRIAPKNIPQIRMDKYAQAIAWLDMAKSGEVTADIPVRQPKQGGRIRWSSQPRQENNY